MLGLGIGLGFNRVIGAPLLLDKFSGAAAAYSLRALSSSTTDVVRVRRSSDNAEQDFSPDEINDGSLESWVGAGNDGFVTTWYDQAGSNDATQTTAANQPQIVDSGTLVTENGKVAIQFDNVNDNLSLSNPIVDFNLFSAFSLQNQQGASEATTYSLSDGSSVYSLHYNRFVSSRYAFSTFISGSSSSIGEVVSGQNIITNISASGIDSWYNNTEATTSGLGRILAGQSVIGSPTYPFDGTMQEMIFYNSDQSANRTAIESNINEYYSIY